MMTVKRKKMEIGIPVTPAPYNFPPVTRHILHTDCKLFKAISFSSAQEAHTKVLFTCGDF